VLVALLCALPACKQILGIGDPSRGALGDGRGGDAMSDAPLFDAAPCAAATKACETAFALYTCTSAGATPVVEPCEWGCLTSGPGPHCGVFQPAGGYITSADTVPDSTLMSATIASTTIDTQTGAITGVRTAGQGVISGIEFTSVGGNNGAFSAGPGWDACTGLGSPDGTRIAAALGAAV